jgi:hypothetical protein
VFAAGDATTVPYKQIIIAMGEGADSAPPEGRAVGDFDHLIRTTLEQGLAYDDQNPAPRLAADLEESPQMLGDWRL